MNKGNATLRDEDVIALRARLRRGESTVAEEALRYEVGRETIRRANRGETFSHLAGGTTRAQQLKARDDAQVAAEALTVQSRLYERFAHAPGAQTDQGAEADPLAHARRQAEEEAHRRRGGEAPPNLLDGGEPPDEGEGGAAALARLRSEAAKAPALRAEGMLEDIAKGG